VSRARNLADVISGNFSIPVESLSNAPNPIVAGTIAYLGMNSAPSGWLKANGAAVSRTTYAALFSAIGTTYGAGNGSTTFNVPDLRGEFTRGWDDGRGVDSGRALGSAQLDQMQRIQGAFTGNRLTVGADNDIGNRAGAFANNSVDTTVVTQIGISGGVATQNVSQRYGFDSGGSPSARVSSTTSGETRARNVALLACIKF
jgi:microcystin-dependent protein